MTGIVDGNPVDAGYTNSKLAAKDLNNTFTERITLANPASGATITNLQQTINNLQASGGISIPEGAGAPSSPPSSGAPPLYIDTLASPRTLYFYSGGSWYEIGDSLNGSDIKTLLFAEDDTNNLTDISLAKLNGIEAGATGDQTGPEIKTLYESEPDTNAFTDSEKTKLGTVETGATGDQTGLEIKILYEAEANTNAFTDAEKSKLAGLESSRFLGTYTSLGSLNTAHPTPVEGSYAHVDTGSGNDVVVYIWDNNDNQYIEQAGASVAETAASIKTKYESNPDTNAFTDNEKTKLSGIETGAEVNRTGAEIKADLFNEADTNNLTDALLNKLNAVEAGAEANTASNIPGGVGLFAQKFKSDLEFKGITGAQEVSVFDNLSEVVLTVKKRMMGPIAGDVAAKAQADNLNGSSIGVSDKGLWSYWDTQVEKFKVWNGSSFETVAGGNSTHPVNQAAHGFALFELISINAGTWVKAESGSASNGEKLPQAMVTKVTDTDNFEITLSGKIEGLSGLSPGESYFSNPATPGGYTSTAPTSNGDYTAPVFEALSSSEINLDFKRVSVVQPAAGVEPALGTGQTWQDLFSSRSIGVTYTNTTGVPIMVSVAVNSADNTSSVITVQVDSIDVALIGNRTNALGIYGSASFVVPANSTYQLITTGGASLNRWAELR